MNSGGILSFVIPLIVIFCLFLILREFWTWYFKQNEIVKKLNRTNELLEKISQELTRKPTTQEKPVEPKKQEDTNRWDCPKCNYSNTNKTSTCHKCGHKLK